MPSLRMSGVQSLVLEALDKVASPATRDRIVAGALLSVRRQVLPSDPVPLSAFVTGPLWEATGVELGDEVADALLQDLGPLLRLAAAHASESIAPVRRQSRTLPPPSAVPKSGVRAMEPQPYRSGPTKHLTAPYVAAWSSDAPANLILVVDDDAHFLAGLTRLLRLEGYDVLDAGSARLALRLCERLRPELVLTDFDMPDMNGVQLAGAIRKQMKGAAPPMVMLTGAANPPLSVSGVARVLRKDIRPSELIDVIDSILEDED
jgi:CheY-like chemotaxis protein